MKVDIVVDTICPWCYIGKRRFDRALALRSDLALEVGWRPFQLNPAMPPEGMDRRFYIAEKFGGKDRARAVHDTLQKIGSEVGIDFDFRAIERTPNTIDSHRLARFAAGQGLQTEAIAALFAAYFENGRDIGDRRVLIDIGQEIGLDPAALSAYLDSDADIATVHAEDDLARRLGVNGVPCFIVDRKYAVSGAQSPEVFAQVFDLAKQDEEDFAVG